MTTAKTQPGGDGASVAQPSTPRAPARARSRRAEDAHLEEIERAAADFIRDFDRERDKHSPREPFAAVTIKFVERVRPLVEQLEDVRRRSRGHRKP